MKTEDCLKKTLWVALVTLTLASLIFIPITQGMAQSSSEEMRIGEESVINGVKVGVNQDDNGFIIVTLANQNAQSPFAKLKMRLGEKRVKGGFKVSIRQGEDDFIVVTLSNSAPVPSSSALVPPPREQPTPREREPKDAEDTRNHQRERRESLRKQPN